MKKAVEGFSAHLRKHGLRLTSERRKLVEMILKMKGHFSPESVVEKLREKRAGVSRATVYRLLPVLVEANLIQQSLFSEGLSRFEVTWNKEHHDHLICSSCNKIIEFQHSTIEILQKEIANKYGFSLDHHVMELVGRCRECH